MLTSRTVDLLGRRLIAYMLDIGVADVDAVIEDPDNDHAVVLTRIEQIGETLAARAEGMPGDDALALTAIVSSIGEAPLANVVRGLVAEDPPIDLSDRPLALLQAIAFDALPSLIAEDARRDPAEPWRSVRFSPGAIYNHPAAPLFLEAVLADADLSRLYPARDESGEAIGVHLYASGTGGHEQALMLAPSLLRAAWMRCGLDTPDEAFVALSSVLQSARALGRNSVSDSTVHIGFRGLHLPEGDQVVLPWGTLRPRQTDGLRDELGCRRFDAELDAVLETTRSVPVLIRESFDLQDAEWTATVRQ